jgi:hypothetical protein
MYVRFAGGGVEHTVALERLGEGTTLDIREGFEYTGLSKYNSIIKNEINSSEYFVNGVVINPSYSTSIIPGRAVPSTPCSKADTINPPVLDHADR